MVYGPGNTASYRISKEEHELVTRTGLCDSGGFSTDCKMLIHLLTRCNELALSAGQSLSELRQDECPPVSGRTLAWELAEQAGELTTPRALAMRVWHRCSGMIQTDK